MAEVRQSITADPETGIARQPLGLTDDTLFVESITRLSFFITVVNLTVDPSLDAQVKSDIEAALTQHFRSLRPFVEGLDPEFDRNDVITDLTISEVVQNVLFTFNASSDGVAFSFSFVLPNISRYVLQPGETTKLGDTQYV